MDYDYSGNDIINAGSINQARAECDSRPNCVAFNTDGWLKGPTLPQGGSSSGRCVWMKVSSPALGFPPAVNVSNCPWLKGCNLDRQIRTRVDCDGDGALDWACEDPDVGQLQYWRSSDGCRATGPYAPRTGCPSGLGK
jgi:hypothetical protein